MNFFEHQARARAQTRNFVWLFVLAVVAIVAAVDLAVLIALSQMQPHAHALQLARENPGIAVWASLATLAVIGLSALYKTATLRGGGGKVAQSLGGTLVPPDTNNARLRRLRNVVEEIAIASGVPVPEIYVLAQEPGINAFAAGYTPADAAVTVTQGCLDKLSRDELQGVIAHEFSHVLNGDMRLNIRLMGLLFGILVLHVIGREVLDSMTRRSGIRYSSGSKKEGGNPVALIALALMIVGLVGVFFGRLIKARVSRTREFLADASAVQFTRQTNGIAGALKKIAGVDHGSTLEAKAKAEEAAHMFFGDGVGYSALFATHPPLFERIRRLEPQFKPDEIAASAAQWNDPSYAPLDEEPLVSGLQAGAGGAPAPGAITEMVAHPSSEDYEYAQVVHGALPAALLTAVQHSAGVTEVACALLLDSDASVRGRQLELVSAALGQARRQAVEAVPLDGLGPGQRLPLVALGFPALRQLPREQLIGFLALVSKLVHVDGRVGLFEWCLGRVLRSEIADVLSPSTARMAGRKRLPELSAQVDQLFSALAHYGTRDEAAARRAYAAGVTSLLPNARTEYSHEVDLKALDAALMDLDKLLPAGKALLVEAMLRTMSHDGRFTVGESELLRAVCAGLHCPLPALVKAA